MTKILPFTESDLVQIGDLQPFDWDNILPHFQYYLASASCHPFCLKIGPQIVAVGTVILHQNTAWLAHVIVHAEYRNRGLGQTITQNMVDWVRKLPYSTILLIATELGEPVYRKVGFVSVGTYHFYKKEPGNSENFDHPCIQAFEEKHEREILEMDQKKSGENRSQRLRDHFQGASVYLDQERVKGFYLPSLGDGLIVAENQEAGLALMKFRLNSQDNAVLPVDNDPGNLLLLELGFVHYRTAKRMVLGPNINWRPECLYNRISGQIG